MRKLVLLLCLLPSLAFAQTPPSTAEVSAYDGLFKAAYDGDAASIERLAGGGADLNARDAHGRTPALVAAFASQELAFKALVAAGADPNAQDEIGYDAVTIAAVADDAEFMSLALSLGNRPNLIHTNWDGTALIAASELGNDEVVRRLIKAGAPLDHINNLGWTALIEAIVLGDGGPRHVATVKALVEAGADVSITDRNGMTPLQLAKARGFGDIVRILNR
ncbi:MAG: ankyrin repeat domain-containing protein [Paracoccaceae bacterium]